MAERSARESFMLSENSKTSNVYQTFVFTSENASVFVGNCLTEGLLRAIEIAPRTPYSEHLDGGEALGVG